MNEEEIKKIITEIEKLSINKLNDTELGKAVYAKIIEYLRSNNYQRKISPSDY